MGYFIPSRLHVNGKVSDFNKNIEMASWPKMPQIIKGHIYQLSDSFDLQKYSKVKNLNHFEDAW